jgi:hypothetical protein
MSIDCDQAVGFVVMQRVPNLLLSLDFWKGLSGKFWLS